MNMKSLFWICGVPVSIFFLITCWLAYQNWASEKVLSTILPALAIGTVSALVTILFSLKSETKEIEFPVIFIFDSASKKPLELPVPASLGPEPDSVWRYVNAIKEQTSSSMKNKKTIPDSDLYFDILLRMTLDVLFETYHLDWNIKQKAIDLPYMNRAASWSQNNSPETIEFVALSDIKRWFPEVHILEIANPPFEKMAVPPKSRVKGNSTLSGRENGGGPFERELHLNNPFVTIDITLSQAGGQRGLGKLAPLIDPLPQQDSRFYVAMYNMHLVAQFNALRSGHSDMPKYQRWVDIMFDQLQTKLDERKHWEKVRDQFLLFSRRQEQKAETNQEEK